jgi:quercetin dioxygenase-like cupin family protein
VVIDGTIEFTVSGEKLLAKAGENVWVARGTVHSFVVTSDVCHVLNGYTPMASTLTVGMTRAAPVPRAGQTAPNR